MFKDLGAKVINADKIAQDLIKPNGKCYKKVKSLFKERAETNGKLDRAKIAGIVFKNRTQLKRLEKIIHPEVLREIKRSLNRYKTKKNVRVILDIPLLFESRMNTLCDTTIVVNTKQIKQIERTVKKFNISKAETLRRIHAQWPLSKKIKRANYVIDNNGTLKQTQKQVKQLWQKL